MLPCNEQPTFAVHRQTVQQVKGSPVARKNSADSATKYKGALRQCKAHVDGCRGASKEISVLGGVQIQHTTTRQLEKGKIQHANKTI